MSFRTKMAVAGLAVLGVLLLTGAYAASTYNTLIRLDEQEKSQWAQVENTYQRRMDLVPNLVETVKGAAGFEKSTYLAVAEARAKVGQVSTSSLTTPANDPAQFAKFQQAQDGLS